MQQRLAEQLYGSAEDAVGKVVSLGGLPFSVIGTLREGAERLDVRSYHNSLAIPYSVARLYTRSPNVRQLYFFRSGAVLGGHCN